MDKKTFRKQIMEIRSQLPQTCRDSAANIVFKSLIALEEFQNANVISSFVSFRDEISMDQINNAIIASGKTLALPAIDSNTKTMSFYDVKDLSELELNHFGILEPNPARHKKIETDAIECVLTPGVAFDRYGYRLGYGGGFYDRLFSDIKKTIPKIGIAFDLQCVDKLPVESYDLPIHKLITESGLTSF